MDFESDQSSSSLAPAKTAENVDVTDMANVRQDQISSFSVPAPVEASLRVNAITNENKLLHNTNSFSYVACAGVIVATL